MKTIKDKDIYCLIGNPVSKSLSPTIHNSYFELIGENSIYFTFEIKEEKLELILEAFKILNVKGFNVTIPHKITIINYLDEVSEDVKVLGAVNTVRNLNGKLIGFNTDGKGFLKSLEMEKIDVKDKKILVLGAGGAANAISVSLAMEGVKSIIIANRTISKAETLSDRISSYFPKIEVKYDSLKLENVKKKEVDMIVNCTSVGMYPNQTESPIDIEGFQKNLIVYDIIYKPKKTRLLQLAEFKGYKTINGISMLINQGLCSQEIWLGKKDLFFLENFEKIRRILKNYIE